MYRVLLLIAFPLYLVGCTSGDNDTNHHLVEMKFDVNQELLGNVVSLDEAGIGFQPPKDWTHLSEDMFDEAVERITQTLIAEDRYINNPKYIFLDKKNGSAMVITTVAVQNIHAFRTDLHTRLEDSNYLDTEFLKDGIHIYQYLIQSDDIVNFKLLFRDMGTELLQVDFIVPRAVYASVSKTIESSIGSIHFLVD